MTAILSLIRKEFIQIRRDPRLLPILFVAPIVQLLILGYAANFDVRDIPLVVCDQDRSAASRDYLAGFFNSGYFSEKARVDSPGAIDAFLDNGRASLAIVIPRGFGDDEAAGREARVQIIADGSDSSSATVGLGYANLVSGRWARKILLERLARIPGAGTALVPFEPKVRVWYNPDLRSLNFMAPAVLAMILMIMTMMLTSMGIVREKERGTLEQLIVTPIRPWELILGKLLPFVLVGFIDALLVVGVVSLWFRVPLRGSLLLLFGLSTVFMLTTLGLGLFLSTISRNQQQAMLTAVFFMVPQILLSGFAFPIENMPRFFQLLTTIIPLKYYLTVIRGIFLKGVGWPELWDEAVAMLAFGVIILALSVVLFRKRVE